MRHSVSRNVQATYRLQMGPDLTFERISELLPYFRDLGISHLYLSPCFKSALGSLHGYDVVDPSAVNPLLGGQDGFEHLCLTSAGFDIKLVLDTVPNHMAAAGRQNPWWWDVLTHGQDSRYAGYFDICWNHPDLLTRGKVLLPVLGDELERCLQSRQIQIQCRNSEICLVYFEHEFPISPLSHAYLLKIHDAAQAVESKIAAINADPVRLKAFLSLQYYRLEFWRRAIRDLNYRRFFDIHQLIGMCVEKEDVFAATHELLLHWIKDGKIDGLRIDHPDGLRDPTSYLKRLRAAAPRTWVVVEKILGQGERLAPEWPVDGTTGYDFLNLVNAIFVDSRSEQVFTDFYKEFTGQSTDYRQIIYEKKHLVLECLFNSEFSRLVELLKISRRRYPGMIALRPEDDRRALAEVIACFPVYRTYIRPVAAGACDRDRQIVRDALTAARCRQTGIACDSWQLIENILLLTHTGKTESEFVWRFQQLTGSVMAKGMEDTAFYCFNRLLSLNEVGGNPETFGMLPEAFHSFCFRIQDEWPQSMLASATHDTKRGEDTRLRIDLLSEIPERWTSAVRRWHRMNMRFCRDGFPDANTEYFLYQTLLGSWPIGCDRLVPAMIKSAREAKVFTSWTDPNPAFEEALKSFIEDVMGNANFLADLSDFLKPLARPAAITSLSQTLIKCTAPGVPDIYQGSELWDMHLMDPDNRRPVDFELRRRLLSEISTLSPAEILKRSAEGLPKLFLLQRVLSTRRQVAEAFGPRGDYRPLAARGERSNHLVAFIRGGRIVTLVPRLVIGLADDWKETVIELPAGIWENVFSNEIFHGGIQKLSRMLACFPVALLVRKGDMPYPGSTGKS